VSRAAIVAALDALELGGIREAESILLSVLEDVDVPRRLSCKTCGLRFKWPGELDDHERLVHPRAA
jgi:HEAT repeat protein